MSKSIEINGVFIKNDDKEITEIEINDFVDSVILMAEEKGFSFTGILEKTNKKEENLL